MIKRDVLIRNYPGQRALTSLTIVIARLTNCQ
jgi:hypothetical protein